MSDIPPKGFPVEEIYQLIKDKGFLEDFTFDPETPRRFYISNVVARVLAHLIAKGPNGAVQLECDAAGNLKTTAISGSPQYSDTTQISGSSSLVKTTLPDFSTNILIRNSYGTYKFRHSLDDIVYSDWIHPPSLGVFFAPLQCKYIETDLESGGTYSVDITSFYS